MIGKKVMVVDPSQKVSQRLGSVLAESRCQPVMVSSLGEALAINIQKDVDAIALEMQQEDEDSGIAAIEKIRAVAPDTPIIAMCSKDFEADHHILKKARFSDVDAVVTKPFDPAVFVSIVEEIKAQSFRNRTRVFLVDDLPKDLQDIQEMLPESRYSLSVASSAEEALYRPDLVGADVFITDIFMPGMGGIEAITKVQKSWPYTGIIAISAGYGESMSQNHALEAASKVGAHATLNKPFKAEDLCLLVDSLASDQKTSFLDLYGDEKKTTAG